MQSTQPGHHLMLISICDCRRSIFDRCVLNEFQLGFFVINTFLMSQFIKTGRDIPVIACELCRSVSCIWMITFTLEFESDIIMVISCSP